MPGLSTVLLSGLSGLRAAQTSLGVASQNIANANTPGYVRGETVLAPRSGLGDGGGVQVVEIRRAADRFLAAASHIAQAKQGSAAVRADLLDRAQTTFGDPASDTSLFATLDGIWTSLTQLGADPSSQLRRSDVVSALEVMFEEIERAGVSLQSIAGEADRRIGDAVGEAQSLIDRIAELNQEIRLSARTGSDATAAENTQSALIDELSVLMDVRVTQTPDGGVQVRTSGGALLVGVEAARLAYTPSGGDFSAYGVIRINEQLGAQINLEPLLQSGEIKGLLELRDRDLPRLAESLAGFSAGIADTLNAVHNENAAWPAASQLTGRQTGLLAGDALGFTGNAIIGVADGSGALRQRLTIDFDAGTITGVAPAATYSFTNSIGAFTAALNTALGAATPSGGASFVNGVMSVSVPGGGVVVQQDSADPSARAGRGFSHFFGLNDIATRSTPLFFQSGLDGADAHGLQSGGAITYQVRDANGRYLTERTVTISGPLVGGSNNALLAALNATGTGFGEFGAFSLDAATGQVTFAANPAFTVDLLYDTTLRGGTGISFTALNGLSRQAIGARSLDIEVNAAISADASRLGVGRPDLSVAIGSIMLEAGDNRGAAALLAARDRVHAFPAAGLLSAQSTTLSSYAARLGGEAGRLAADAERAERGASAVATAASDRRMQVEGVSLDDELMKMTVYQNAYAASARVIQAATDMLDILLSLGYR
ncbi:MAG: flagellar hook-associated protein FlgK [Hyphomonadaceae bacterium]|nr:flagellar hook-associated protein FlgK [Hyphomonadaceae bacterium]